MSYFASVNPDDGTKTLCRDNGGGSVTSGISPTDSAYLAWAAINGEVDLEPDEITPPTIQERAIEAFQSATQEAARRDRAIVLVSKDEVNILRRQIVGVVTATVNPPNLVNGAVSAEFNVTVDGGTAATKAAFGDVVILTAPYDVQGLLAYGWVQDESTGNVRARIFNPGVGTVNLASGDWKIIVWRPESLAPRTKDQAKAAIENKIDDEESD